MEQTDRQNANVSQIDQPNKQPTEQPDYLKEPLRCKFGLHEYTTWTADGEIRSDWGLSWYRQIKFCRLCGKAKTHKIRKAW